MQLAVDSYGFRTVDSLRDRRVSILTAVSRQYHQRQRADGTTDGATDVDPTST